MEDTSAVAAEGKLMDKIKLDKYEIYDLLHHKEIYDYEAAIIESKFEKAGIW